MNELSGCYTKVTKAIVYCMKNDNDFRNPELIGAQLKVFSTILGCAAPSLSDDIQ